jgi:hypothetical protein
MKMKMKIRFTLIVFTAFIFSHTLGQGRPSLSLGAELGVPAGTLNTTQKIGVGGSAKVAFPVGSDLDITASAGYISYSGDEVGNTKRPAMNFIPIKAGARYRFVPSGFYIEPQLGYTSVNSPGSSGATGGFTYAANAGYIINRNWDISGRYEAISLKNNINYPQVVFRLAYSFGL